MPDGEYPATISGSIVVIEDGPITTQFKTDRGVEGSDDYKCKAVIQNGFADIILS